jgi:hypothetical protein
MLVPEMEAVAVPFPVTLAVADASSVRTVAVMLLGLVAILPSLEVELELERGPLPAL